MAKKLETCLLRVENYLDDEKMTWEDIFGELVQYNKQISVSKNDTPESVQVSKQYLKKLPDIKEFIDTEADTYRAIGFQIRILSKPEGPWHGNIIIMGQNSYGDFNYVTLNHWYKGIGLINIGADYRGDIRCELAVRDGLTLKDVIIYGLKWWYSVDKIFKKKYYSKQLWPASCHGLADTVAFHIAHDYSNCKSVAEWWKENKERVKLSFSRRRSRKVSRRRSRKVSRRR